MVFTGVTNGEALWSLPPRGGGGGGGPGSPENSSDGGSVVGQSQRHGSIAGSVGGGGQAAAAGGGLQAAGGFNVMQELDWVSFFSFSFPFFFGITDCACCEYRGFWFEGGLTEEFTGGSA